MSKSTPISQLPSTSVDINSITDVIEDDATVQEVLNQISMASNATPPTPTMTMPQIEVVASHTNAMPVYNAPPPQQQQQQPQQATMMSASMAPPPQPQAFYFQMPPQSLPSMESLQDSFTNAASPVLPPPAPQKQGLLANLTSELRTILLVVIITVAVQIIPMEAVLLRYAPLARIPYAQILAKGFAAGALFFVVRRYLD